MHRLTCETKGGNVPKKRVKNASHTNGSYISHWNEHMTNK